MSGKRSCRAAIDRRTFLRSSAAVIIGAPALAAVPRRVRDIGSEPQLFLDDWLIESVDGVRRTLHSPDKRGLLKEEDGRDWERGDVYHGNIVCRDNAGKFHMTYRYWWWDPSVRDLDPNIGVDRAHWFRECVAYARSDDGIHWHKPELGLLDGPDGFSRIDAFPFEQPTGMSRANNLGCPIDFITDLNAHGNVADPARRFLLRVAKRADTHPFAKELESHMYYASDWPDFANDPGWLSKLTPIPDATLSPRGFRVITGHDAGEWFMVAQDSLGNWVGRGGREIGRYASPDLKQWTGPDRVLAVPDDEPREPADWVEYMDMSAYRVGGPKTGFWLGLLCVFHSDRTNDQYRMPTNLKVWRKGLTECRLMMSRDAGKSWQRVGEKQVWLPHHVEENGYDRLVFARCPTRVGDEQWFYYACWDGDHLVFNADGTTYYKDRMRTSRTALAVLRHNGYISFNAEDQGIVSTVPLTFDGANLVLNASPRGSVRVAVCDAEDRPLHGLSESDCIPVTTDGISVPVRWNSGATLSSLRGGPVRLKFYLDRASLYGFQFA
ncbi:MAG: hypothetical protein HUU46_21520 [Candidatus Hydrogenedentes bacterium]|nr:hypothetical protein [Candidatus Hydrogenedentota bacterium]